MPSHWSPALIGDSFLVIALAMLPPVAALWGRGAGARRSPLALVLAVSVLAMLSFAGASSGLTQIPSGYRPKADLLWLGAGQHLRLFAARRTST